MKQDLIFFCCLLRIRENFQIMRMLKKIIEGRKQIPFSLIDALIIYYYLILGLQADKCISYLEFYMKYIYNANPHNLITDCPVNITV